MMRGRNALPRVAALLGGAVVVCAAIVLSQRTGLAAHAPMSRISLLQMLEEEKEQLAGLGPEVYQSFNLCQSCLAECPAYKEAGCLYGSLEEACLPTSLVKACEECGAKGCAAVVTFIDEDTGLDEAGEGDDAAKVKIYHELAWKEAQNAAIEEMPQLKTCITGAATVGLAERCLSSFLHSMPAALLAEAASVAKSVGPPVCTRSYLGAACAPLPSPSAHAGSCPQGFMCMPDPDKCESCACSCNSPKDKLDELEHCIGAADGFAAGRFCLATVFSQLPPDFVDSAVERANEPTGASEHYEQIVEACGGAEELSACLKEVEKCVRPIQGPPGTFPADYEKFQGICNCFDSEDVQTACGADEDEEKACVGAVQEHFTLHVQHQYCLDGTETACEFQCKWPLPGFFGDVAKIGEDKTKAEAEAEAK